MALFTSLASLSQTPGSNAPDGAVDAPSTIDDQMRSLAAFSAQLRDGTHQWATAVGGTNTITLTVAGVSSLVAGQTFRFVAAGANTGAVTVNVNSLGAKSVLKHGSSALVAGDIANLSTVVVTYDGTNFQLTGVAQSSSLGTSGWAKFSNGLIVQWGAPTMSSSGVTTSFATAFPTACIAGSVTHTGTSPANVGAVSFTASSSAITIYSANPGPYFCTFIALGY